MKKRIISLILVVAMALLALTGCAYSYSKDDMSKYTTFDATAFFNALTVDGLKITDADFGVDEEGRQVKVQDAIAQAILKVTDATDKKYSGKLANYDSLYFCYFATAEVDGKTHTFYANKMDASSATNFQLGLSTLSDFNKLINDKVLEINNIDSYIYSTSADAKVAEGDVVSISYLKTKAGEDNGTIVMNELYTVANATDSLNVALIGAKAGEMVPGTATVKVEEGGVTTEYIYSNIEVESIAYDKETAKVKENDAAFISYTYSFNAAPYLNADTGKYDLPEGLDAKNVNAEGYYSQTVSYSVVGGFTADPSDATPETKTFLGQLVGTAVNTTKTLTIKNDTFAVPGQTISEVKYTNVKVNWIVDDAPNSPIEVKYTPYEALSDTNTTEKTETNTYGEKIKLNGVELTYYIFPVYYLDVAELSAEVVLGEFVSTVLSTQTAEHDHTEEEHEHTTEYVFDILNDKEYKNGEKTLEDLVKELSTLYSTLTEKEKAESSALTSYKTAASNYAKDDGKSQSETNSLKSKYDTARGTYVAAKTATGEAQQKVNEKIAEILACKKGETSPADGIVAGYKEYQYDALETAYESAIVEKLATKIVDYLIANVKFDGDDLPKKAVNNAYDAIMNTYKNDFYENKYTSSSSSSTSNTTSTETNYAHYDGDFDSYLIDKVLGTKTGTIEEAEAKVKEKAETTVKEIMIIYILTDAVNAKWSGADVTLTKDEKKEMEEYYENLALLYQQYGLAFSYNIDDSYHAGQFDKAMNYLLEIDEDNEENKIVFKNLKYDWDVPATE